MSKTIWKFPLLIGDNVKIMMPAEAVVVKVAAEAPHTLAIWAIVDSRATLTVRKFTVRGTGHPLDDVGAYLGTVQDDPFVWHIFEGADQ